MHWVVIDRTGIFDVRPNRTCSVKNQTERSAEHLAKKINDKKFKLLKEQFLSNILWCILAKNGILCCR